MATRAGLDFTARRCQAAQVNSEPKRGVHIMCCVYMAHIQGEPRCDLQPLTSREFAAWCKAAGWPVTTKHVNPAPLLN